MARKPAHKVLIELIESDVAKMKKMEAQMRDIENRGGNAISTELELYKYRFRVHGFLTALNNTAMKSEHMLETAAQLERYTDLELHEELRINFKTVVERLLRNADKLQANTR